MVLPKGYFRPPTDGRTVGRSGGREDGMTDGPTGGRTVGRAVGRTDGRWDGRVDGGTDGRASGRADGRTGKEIWHEKYGYWRSKERYVGLSSCRETKYVGVVKSLQHPVFPGGHPSRY